MVYIQEAHPSDLWQLPSNVKDEVVFSSPKTFDERVSVASACVRNLGIEFPALLDRIEDSTERAYTGWPDRLYVIDLEGRVAYKSDPGPYGFATGGMEEALKKVLGSEKTAAALGPDDVAPHSAKAAAVEGALPEGASPERAGEHRRKP